MRIILFSLASLLVLSACSNQSSTLEDIDKVEQSGDQKDQDSDKKNNQDSENTNKNQDEQDRSGDNGYNNNPQNLPGKKLSDERLNDLESLKESVEKLHDYIGFTYHEDQLEKLKQYHSNQNYEYVLSEFLKSKFNAKISTVEILNKDSNSLTLMVITENNHALKVIMAKKEDYNSIWVVNGVAVLN